MIPILDEFANPGGPAPAIPVQLASAGGWNFNPFDPNNDWWRLNPADPNAYTPGLGASGAASQQAHDTGTIAGIDAQYIPEILLGIAAVGGMIMGLWLLAGSPRPEVIPIPA
jgi:hypothetical protein